jgi:hypothetical protein
LSDLSQRLPETLSGRHRIERELGRGGMATDSLAEDLNPEEFTYQHPWSSQPNVSLRGSPRQIVGCR